MLSVRTHFPDCVDPVTFASAPRVIRNYETLTNRERELLPAESYWNARAMVDMIKAQANRLRNAETAKGNVEADEQDKDTPQKN